MFLILSEIFIIEIFKHALLSLQREKDFLEKYFSLRFEGEDLTTFPKINAVILPNKKDVECFLFKIFNNVIFLIDLIKIII